MCDTIQADMHISFVMLLSPAFLYRDRIPSLRLMIISSLWQHWELPAPKAETDQASD